jgi:hypothetical protein
MLQYADVCCSMQVYEKLTVIFREETRRMLTYVDVC